MKTLPGIGDYSAGAIASIAFGVRTLAADGNVLRVMARLTANTGNIADRTVRGQLEKTAEALLPTRHIGDFNQALMDPGCRNLSSERRAEM